jgi:phosphoglycolate phosphatase-like HAD superfamily hydrolase
MSSKFLGFWAATSRLSGISKAIEDLSKKYILTVVSSAGTASIKKVFEYHGLLKYFQEILGYDLEASKILKIKILFESFGVGAKE